MNRYLYKYTEYDGSKKKKKTMNFFASSRKIADQMAEIFAEKNLVELTFSSSSSVDIDVSAQQAETEQFIWLDSLVQYHTDA